MLYEYSILILFIINLNINFYSLKAVNNNDEEGVINHEIVNLLDKKPFNNGRVTESFDWRDCDMVSPVKDQLNCDACWAFSAIANTESHLNIYTDNEIALSEQFLIDCDEENNGCGNGSVLKTFANIVTYFGGVLRDIDYYSYSGRRERCRWKRLDISNTTKVEEVNSPSYPMTIPVIGFRRVYPDENVMAKYVYKYGPLSAAINSASMVVYHGGIEEPTDSDCNPKELNHDVLIVGYNEYVSRKTGRRVPYWIIKNSWGSEWGDGGYYYLVRGRNACGITSDVSFAYVS